MMVREMKMFHWLETKLPTTRYDLASSGMPSQGRNAMYGLLPESGDPLDYEETLAQFTRVLSGIYGVKESQIIPVNGGTEAILIATWFLGSRCRRLLVPVPEYEPMLEVPRYLGLNVMEYPGNVLNIGVGEGDGVMLTSPNNPSGMILYNEDLQHKLGERSGTYAYISETYSDFISIDRAETIFRPGKKMICSNTLTKFYGMSPLRLGWMFTDEENIELLQQIKNCISPDVSIFSLSAAVRVLRDRKHYAETCRKRISENRKILKDFLYETGIGQHEAAMNSSSVFMGYGGSENSTEFCARMVKETGVLTMPGEYFGVDRHFRLGYTSSPKTFSEGLERIREFTGRQSIKLSLWLGW